MSYAANQDWKDHARHLLRFREEHQPRLLDVAGTAWEYYACGSGARTLLLLPGGLRIAEHAFLYIQMFEGAYRLIVPSYPPLNSIDSICDGVAQVLHAEGVEHAYVLGQSYGGTVAQVFIRRYPQVVKKLILSSTAPMRSSKAQARLLDVLAGFVGLLPEPLALNLYRNMLMRVISVPPAEHLFWKGYLKELFALRLNKAHVLSHLHTSQDTIQKYVLPQPVKTSWAGEVLVIGGEKDPVSTEADRRGLVEEYPGAQLCVLTGLGHTAGWEQPVQYAEAVCTFLNL